MTVTINDLTLVTLTNQPNQFFSVKIPLATGNKELSFFVNWNAIAGYWQMSLTDGASGNSLLNNIPLVPGASPSQNILRQYTYLGIGSAFVIPTSTATTDYPGVNDWGTNFLLVWGP